SRNRHHQRCCSQPHCRAARKTECQAPWLARPENHDYFSRSVHLARNPAWRAHHPGYWRKSSHRRSAHKDVSTTQVIGTLDKPGIAVQPAVLIGLIARLVGTPQPDDLVRTTDRLLRLGQDILAMSEGPAPAPP